MEYIFVEKSWEESLEAGNLDEALKRIQYQIAMNLMAVHNRFSSNKFDSPVEVYAYKKYGVPVDEENSEKMKIFIDFNYDFIEICHGLDRESKCPKEIVLNDFKNMEKSLQDAMKML